jgi:uncharacterized protein (DUF779 family)
MRRTALTAFATAMMAMASVAPATAQNYRGAWGLYGGGIWFSDLNNNGNPELLILDGDDIDEIFAIGNADLTLEPGWIAGTQLEYWFGNGRFGLRANGAYTERSFDLEFGDGTVADFFGFFEDEDLTFGDVNTWFIDGDLMFRILKPKRDRTFAPFLSVGAGVVIYNPAGSSPVVIPPANAVLGDADVISIDIDDDGDIDDIDIIGGDGNSETVFATPISLGVDILPGWSLGSVGLGIRLEVADHIAWDSPADPLIGDDDFDAVHNVRFTAGIHGLFGRLFKEERVAVVPPPPPAPPAPPAEEMITVCVVDPTTYELENVNAIYVPSTRDTLVAENGQRVGFDTAYPERMPLYVSNADWYVSGRPLTTTVGGVTTEWVTYGGARVIDPTDVTLLGTVNGTPVYAAKSDVADVRDELRELHQTRRMMDLEDMLEHSAKLREALSDLDVVYVPLETGCVVQPLRRVEEVRKVRG